MRNVWNGTSQYSASIVASSFDSFSNFSVSLQKDEDEDARSRIIIACPADADAGMESFANDDYSVCWNRFSSMHNDLPRKDPSQPPTRHAQLFICSAIDHQYHPHCLQNSLHSETSEDGEYRNKSVADKVGWEWEGWMDGWNVVDDQTSNWWHDETSSWSSSFRLISFHISAQIVVKIKRCWDGMGRPLTTMW